MDPENRLRMLEAGKKRLRKFQQKKQRKEKSPNRDMEHIVGDLSRAEQRTHTGTDAEQAIISTASQRYDSSSNSAGHGSNVFGEVLLTNGVRDDCAHDHATLMNASEALAGGNVNVPNGDSFATVPDGDNVVNVPNGDSLGTISDGDSVVNVQNGDIVATVPDGDNIGAVPDGDNVVNVPNGESVVNSQSGDTSQLLAHFQHLQQVLQQEQFRRHSLTQQLAEVQHKRDIEVQAMRQQIAELQHSSPTTSSSIEKLQMQQVEQMQRLQSAHEEELQNLRAEEQRKRAEQVASLTQRLQAQHSEESDALHRQLQQLREDMTTLPESTTALQQKVMLVREQYEQKLTQAEQSRLDEVNKMKEAQQKQLTEAQQLNFKQMEEFKSQVQESVTKQVQSFHEQYQLALSQQQQQFAACQQQLAAVQQENDHLKETSRSENTVDSVGEIASLREQLDRLEHNKQAVVAELQLTCNQLNQQVSSQSVQFANEKRQLEKQIICLEEARRSDQNDREASHASEIEALEQECQQLQEQLGHQKEEFAEERRSFDNRVAEKDEYCRQQCAQLEVTVQSLNSQLEALRDWSQPMESNDQELLAQAEARCKDLQLQNISLERNLLQERSHREHAEQMLEERQEHDDSGRIDDGVLRDWEERCESLEKTHVELSETVTMKEQRIAELEASQTNINDQLEHVEEQNSAHKKEIEKLREDMSTKDNMLLDLANQERLLASQLDELKAAMANQESTYRTQEENYEDTHAGLMKQIEELQSEIRGKESAHLVAVNELRLQYEEQYTQLKDDCHQQTNNLKHQYEVQLEAHARQHYVDESDVRKHLEAERDRALKDYEHECRERERLANDLRCVAEERAALAAQKARLEQRVAEFHEQEQQEAKEGGSRWQKLQAAHHDLQDEHASLKAKFENLEKSYSKVCQEVSRAESSLAELSAVHDEMSNKLQLSEEMSKHLQGELSTVKDVLAAEQEHHIQLNQFESAKEKELERTQEELSRLAEQLNEKETELRERDEECSQLEATLSLQAADLSEIQVRMDRSRQEQERLQSLLKQNDVVNEVEALQTAMDKLKEENVAKNDALEKMARELAETEHKLDSLQRKSFINSPVPVDKPNKLSAAVSNQSALKENLGRHRQILEGKMLEKARLEELLDEQRLSLSQQLEEKAKLEQLLEDKGHLETELKRQRTVLENELSNIGSELEKKQRELAGHGPLLQEVQG